MHLTDVQKVELQKLIAADIAQADCLYTHEEVKAALTRMAQELRVWADKKFPIHLCVLNGAAPTSAVLNAHLADLPIRHDYAQLASYGDDLTSGELRWIVKPTLSYQNETIFIVDDIFDTGKTAQKLKDFCLSQGAREVIFVTLLNKQVANRASHVTMKADISGLTVPDRFLIGFGLDYVQGYCRNLDAIYALNQLSAKHYIDGLKTSSL